MNLESPKVTVQKSAQDLFDQLSNVKNFEKLMPDNIAKFEVIGEDAFIFGLKGMPEIKLKMKEKTAPSQIVLGAASDKLPFTLTSNINSVSDSSSEVQLFFEGEFNAMMAMMIKGPISKFIETLANNMTKLIIVNYKLLIRDLHKNLKA
jgi:ribosome-associated toxin RatA of RatAB toxin-antitoxin module